MLPRIMTTLHRLLPLVLFTTPSACTPPSPEGVPERPNILFLFSDDHAPHAIGAYGSRYSGLDPTPHIDALAAGGMLFENSYCSNSICGPSRAVILTGKHSHKNGFTANGDRFDGDQLTFPKLMQKGGYQTALIGKWHLGSDPQGFDYWDILPGQGKYYNPTFIDKNGERVVQGYCTDLVTDLAIDWLDQQRDPAKPFMLMCQQKAPHRNWMPPLRHLNLYDDVKLPEPATLFDRFEDNAPPARHQEMELDRHMSLVYDLFLDPYEGWDPNQGSDRSGFANLKSMTPEQRAAWDAAFAPENAAFMANKPTGKELVRWKYQRYMKNYLRTIRGLDDNIGRMQSYLAESGLEENTIVIYSSDQGFYLGDHGWYDKRWMYEESLAMPLIVRWPGVTQAGSVDQHLVQNLDYAQTFLELAGLQADPEMQGRSLAGLLRGAEPEDWRSSIYYHYYAYPSVHQVARHYGIRTERYKLIWFYQFDEWELYDLKLDPDELNNIYELPGSAALKAQLKLQLEELRVSYGDNTATGPMPESWRVEKRAHTGPR
jgi:arylsulfatase A-like enzyme